MNIRNLVLASVLSFSAAGLVAHAEDGVVNQDQQRVNQDKQDLHKDNQDIKNANEAIAKDKASGNQEQLKKDRTARHEAKRNKRQDRERLKKDRSEKVHDEKHP